MVNKKLLLTLGVGYLTIQLPNIKKVQVNNDLNIYDLKRKQTIIFITKNNDCNSIVVLDLCSKNNKIKLITLEKKAGLQGKNIVEVYNNYGPIETIKILNKNLHLSIQQYIKVDYIILEKLINDINGIEIKLNDEDKFVMDINEDNNTYLLNGEQAIRYINFKNRAGCTKKSIRQKRVIKSITNRLMEYSLNDFIKVLSDGMSSIETTMNTKELITLGLSCIKRGIDNVEKIKIPSKEKITKLKLENIKLQEYNMVNSLDEIMYAINK